MEKTWYILQLKAEVRRKSWWLICAAMIAASLLMSSMRVPDGENVSVGLYLAEDPVAEEIAEKLESRDSVFRFLIFEEESALREALEAGEIDSGFLFSGQFEEQVEQGHLKESITFLQTPFSAKGMAARETVYAAFLERYSEEILLDERKEIYGKEREDIVPFLLKKNAAYLESEAFFQTEVEELQVQETEEKQAQKKVWPIQGMIGLFIFILLWMTFGRRFEGDGRGISLALDRKRRRRFEYLGYLASATLPAVTGICVILCSGESRGIFVELIRMAVLVFGGALWVAAIGVWFRSSMALSAWVLTVVAVQVVICPVFVDLAAYIPAIKYLKYLFPLGWYL